MKKTVLFGLGVLLAHFSTQSLAVGDGASELSSADKKIRASLAILLPTLKPDAIADSPLPGIYEVSFGPRIIYVDGSGRYILQGKITDLETREEVTESRLQSLKKVAIDAVDEKDMVIYGDKGAEDTITVFTDIDCGYCRKLHGEMDKYIAAGIRVRYLAYPRAGIRSRTGQKTPSAQKLESVWCADDRKQAMDISKQGGKLESINCATSPVADHYSLGRELNISGTPALVLSDGEIIPGYVDAKRLKEILNKKR